MTKSWEEVEESYNYQKLSPFEQQEAKSQYWEEVVQPKAFDMGLNATQRQEAQNDFYGISPDLQIPRESPYTPLHTGGSSPLPERRPMFPHEQEQARTEQLVDIGMQPSGRLEPYPAKPIKEYFKDPVRGARDTAVAAPQILGGLVQEFGERMEEEPSYLDMGHPFYLFKKMKAKFGQMTKVDDRIADMGKDIIKQNKVWMKSKGMGQAPYDKAGKFLYNLGGGATSLAEAVGLTLLTKSPNAAAVAFGFQAKSRAYQEARGAGLSPKRSGELSDLAGGTEAIGEYIGMKFMLQRYGGRVASIAARMATEGTQEWSQELGGNFVAKIGWDKTRDLFQGTGEAALIGMILSAPTSTALSMIEESQIASLLEESGINPKSVDGKRLLRKIIETQREGLITELQKVKSVDLQRDIDEVADKQTGQQATFTGQVRPDIAGPQVGTLEEQEVKMAELEQGEKEQKAKIEPVETLDQEEPDIAQEPEPGVKEMVKMFEGVRDDIAFKIIDKEQTVGDQIGEGVITEEEAFEAIADAGEQGVPEDFQVFGSNIAEFKDGVRGHVVKLFRGGDVSTVIHEVSETYFKPKLQDANYVGKVKAWRSSYESSTGETSKKSDLEWLSDRAVDYAVHKQTLSKAGLFLRKIFDRFTEYGKYILHRANRLRKHIRQGKVDPSLQKELGKAISEKGKVTPKQTKPTKPSFQIRNLVQEAKKYKDVKEFVGSEKDFFKKYEAQHKDFRSKDKQATKKLILEKGFLKEGLNVNAMPINKGSKQGGIQSWSERSYGNKKGDIVYLIPKQGVTLGENGYKTVKGWTPKPRDIIEIKHDGQSSYEAYKQQLTDIWNKAHEADTQSGIHLKDGKFDSLSPNVSYSIRNIKELKALQSDVTKDTPQYIRLKIARYHNQLDNVGRFTINNRELMDYLPNESFKALKKNSDPAYKYSVDFTTMCIKRYVMQSTIDELQLKLNRPLNAKEFMRVREMLQDRGYSYSCGACYVDSRRINSETVIDKALNGFWTPSIKVVDNFNARVKKRKVKAYKQKGKTIDTEYWIPPLKVPRKLLLTTEGTTEVMPKKYPKEYAKFRKLFGGSQIKIQEARAQYDGEILKLSDSVTEAMNRASGLRWQSWSDFEVPHMLDAMQAIGDMSIKGLKGQMYSKVVEAVRLLAPTGMAINMSLIPKGTGFDSKGSLVFDEAQSFPFPEAMRLRKKYNNVGTIAIGISDKHIKALLADPRIDFVIPYHASGLKASFRQMLKMKEWQSYTEVEGWRDAKTGKKINNIDKYVFISEFKGDLVLLDKLAKERGVIPPFPTMRNWKGYEKLITDRRVWGNDGKYVEQKSVTPTFDEKEIKSILASYKKIGPQKQESAKDIVKDFMKDNVSYQIRKVKSTVRRVTGQYIKEKPTVKETVALKESLKQQQRVAIKAYRQGKKEVGDKATVEIRKLKAEIRRRFTPEVALKIGLKREVKAGKLAKRETIAILKLIDKIKRMPIEGMHFEQKLEIDNFKTELKGTRTLEGLKRLYNKINTSKEIGKQRYIDTIEAKRARFNLNKDILIKTIGEPSKPRKSKTITGEPERPRYIKVSRANTLRPMRIFDMLDYGKAFEGVNSKYFYHSVNKVEDFKLIQIRNRTDWMASEMKKIGITENDLLQSRTVDDTKLTVDQMLSIYTGLKNKEKTLAIMFGNRISLVTMNNIVKQMSDKEKALGEAIVKEYGDNYNRLREAYINYFGGKRDLGKVPGGYTPIRRTSMGYVENEQEFVNELLMRNNLRKAYPERGFGEKRKHVPKEFQQPIRLGELNLWNEMVNKQEHFINYGDLVKDLQRMANDREFTTAVENRYGKEYVEEIKGYVNRVGNPNIYKAYSQTDKAISTLRRNVAIAYLGFNLVTIGKQLPSIALFLGEVNPAQLLGGMYDITTNFKKKLAFIHKLAPQMKERAIERELEELKNRAPTQYGRLLSKVGKIGMKGIYAMDQMVTHAGWLAAYNKYTTGKNALSPQEAADKATRLILRTQPAAHAKDIAGIYAKSEVVNMFLQFSQQLNQIYNMVTYDIPISARTGRYSDALRNAAGVAISAYLIAWMSKGKPPETKEELKEAAIDAGLAYIPVVGTGLNGMRKGFDFTSIPALSGGRAIGSAGMNLFKGKYKKMSYDILEAYVVSMGIPYSQPKRTIKGVSDLYAGRTKDIRRLIYSEYALKSSSKGTGKRVKRSRRSRTTRRTRRPRR